jgi:hypothetical protein
MRLRAQAVVLLLTCLASVLALGLVTAPARAADGAAQTARQHFQEGVVHYAEKRFAKARLAFIQAYALERQPAVLLKLAESELRSGHAADAAVHFSTYLRENAQGGAAERRDAEKGLAAAKAKVGEVSLKTDADGAEIFVDGQPEGSAPLSGPLYLEPGKHSIEARKDGKVATIEISARAGIATTANLSLGQSASTPAAPQAASAPPESAASSSPPEADTGVESGDPDSTGKREPFLKWFGRKKLAWAGVGLTAIGTAGGIVTAVSASNSYDRAETVANEIRIAANQDGIAAPCASPATNPRASQYMEACGKHSDNVDRGDRFRTLSVVSFVVAGAAAVGTVVYYFVDSKPKKASAQGRAPQRVEVGVTPMAAPSFGGVSVSGAF